MKYLTTVMNASRTSSNQLMWLGSDLSTRGMVAGVATWWRPSWLTSSPGTCCQVAQRTGWIHMYFLYPFLSDCGSIRAGPTLPLVFVCSVGWVYQQCDQVFREVWRSHKRPLVLPLDISVKVVLWAGAKNQKSSQRWWWRRWCFYMAGEGWDHLTV